MKIKKPSLGIGLDIGTHYIKIVKLKFAKDTAELCGFDLQPSAPETLQTLKKLKESQGIDLPVVIGICGASTVIRYVNFPKMNLIELKKALKFEAQKHIPFSLPEVNLDGYILKEELPDNKMLILIAAAKKEFLSPRLKSVEDSSFKVGIVDIDSLAVINSFNFNYPLQENPEYKSVALLNIGATLSNLNILEEGIPRLSRDIHIAGNNFTQKLMEALNLDLRSAESVKLNADSKNPDDAKLIASAEPVVNSLTTEIRTSFDYFESQSTSTVSRIFLSGSASKFLGLKEALSNSLGIAVEHWEPFKKITLPPEIDAAKLKSNSSAFAVAVGLALRGALSQ